MGRAPECRLLLLLLSGVLGTCLAKGCGQNFDLSGTISPPENVDLHDLWPWLASFGYERNSTWIHKCSGVVVSDRHILTAAHCVYVDNWSIRLGVKNLNSPDAVERSIMRVTFHPDYDSTDIAVYHDVAIIHVQPFALTPTVSPICLFKVHESSDGGTRKFVTVQGWGGLGQDTGQADVETPKHRLAYIYETETCKRAIDSMMDNKLVSMDARLLLPQGVDDDLMFCVGLSKDGLGGACRGDHGSPIVRFYKFADNQIGSWVLLGVLAGGVGECGQEELQDTPSFAARIDVDFVNEVLSKAEDDDGNSDDGDDNDDESKVTDHLDVGSGIGGQVLAAAVDGVLHLVKFFLDHGVDPNTADTTTNMTLLHKSCRNSHPEIVELVLDYPEADVNARDAEGRVPLQYCAMSGNIFGLKLLLDGGADVNSTDNYGVNSLMEASFYGHGGVLKVLLSKGAYTNAVSLAHGRNALHYAVMDASVDVVQILVEATDINVDLKDHLRLTPFDVAIGFGNLEVVRYFLLNGHADVNGVGEDNLTPLMRAVQFGHNSVVILLLEEGADINAANDVGRTALHLAAADGKTNLVRTLMDKGADKTKRDNSGFTPEMLARSNGFDFVADLFVEVDDLGDYY